MSPAWLINSKMKQRYFNMSVLVIAEHYNQTLKPATLNTIAAAAQLQSPIHVLVAGQEAQSVADAAAQIDGVEKVLLAQGAALEHGLAENVAKQVLQQAEGYSHILFPSTTIGKTVAPRAAPPPHLHPLSLSHIWQKRRPPRRCPARCGPHF